MLTALLISPQIFPEYFSSMSLAHPLRAKKVSEVDNSPFIFRKRSACSCQYNFS